MDDPIDKANRDPTLRPAIEERVFLPLNGVG